MSDRVSLSEAYDTRFDMSYTMVSNGVLGGDTRSDILRFCRIQHIVCDKSDRVPQALGGETRSDILRFYRIEHVVCEMLDRVS